MSASCPWRGRPGHRRIRAAPVRGRRHPGPGGRQPQGAPPCRHRPIRTRLREPAVRQRLHPGSGLGTRPARSRRGTSGVPGVAHRRAQVEPTLHRGTVARIQGRHGTNCGRAGDLGARVRCEAATPRVERNRPADATPADPVQSCAVSRRSRRNDSRSAPRRREFMARHDNGCSRSSSSGLCCTPQTRRAPAWSRRPEDSSRLVPLPGPSPSAYIHRQAWPLGLARLQRRTAHRTAGAR
jgi:hypothetical protein